MTIPLSASFPSQDWQTHRAACFRRTTDPFGGFSNMSKAFPLSIYGIRIRSSEHIYQAMRFTDEPEVQQLVLDAHTPMFSKRVSREWDSITRSDWMDIRVDVMRWALRVKLAQHVAAFGDLLKSTRTQPIVEYSRHDEFWGAGPIGDETLRGQNVLGRLLSELRDEFLAQPEAAVVVPAPPFPKSKLLGLDIGVLCERDDAPLITAADLREAGLPPGPAFGPVLKACVQKQWNGEFNDRPTGLQIARELWVAHTQWSVGLAAATSESVFSTESSDC